MSLLSFFGRRLVTGAASRVFVNLLVKKFRLSPSIANLIAVVLMETIARQTEKSRAGAAGAGSTTPRTVKPKFGKR